MNLSIRTRLLRDFLRLHESATRLILSIPTSDILIWNAVMYGPEKTPYEDIIVEITLVFTEDYPEKPPSVRFNRKVFHPNVKNDGSVSREIFTKTWNSNCDVLHVLSTIQTLLGNPNLQYTLNPKAAKLFKRNRKAYVKKVKKGLQAY